MVVTAIHPLIEPITWALAHFLWQGTLAAGVLGVLLLLTRRATPWTRYRIACWTLLLMVAMPVATLIIEAPSSASARGWGPGTVVAARALESGDTKPAEPVAAGASERVSARSPVELGGAVDALRWSLFAIWLLGVTALSALHSVGWLRVRRLVTHHASPAPVRWQRRADELARRLGLSRVVRVLQSGAVSVPTVIGWLRPVVLLPIATLTGLEARQLESVIAHELAHVWRRDYLVNLLQVAAETVLFYHPAVWWVSRRIREEREHCCDDAAVALTGERLALARALLRLEEQRRPALRLAPAAGGGSLVNRISRLLGGETMVRRHIRHPLLDATLLLAVVAAAGLGWSAVAAGPSPAGIGPIAPAPPLPAVASVSSVVGASGSQPAAVVSGAWRATEVDGELRLRLETGSGSSRSTLGLRVEPSQLVGLSDPGAHFELRRDAGIIRFDGTITGGTGSGIFSFEPDWEFLEYLSGYGIDGYDGREMLVLAATGVDRAFVSELDVLGYGDQLEGELLIALGIHGVSPDYVRDLTSRGLDGVPLDELLAMRIHGVTAEFVDDTTALGYEIEPEMLLAWRIHGVDREFIEAVRAEGMDELSSEDLVAMRVHGVSPSWLREMESQGFGPLESETAIAFRVHGVSPDFLREFEDLGYSGLGADDLLAMRVHGVSTDFVEELRGLGYDNVSVGKLVAMKVHGVSIAFIEQQQQESDSALSIDDLIEMKVLGHR